MSITTIQERHLNNAMKSNQDVFVGTLLKKLEEEVFGVSTYAELVAAIADTTKDIIILQSDITLTDQLVINHPLSIYGNGHSLIDSTLDATQYIALQIMAEDVIIDGVTFEISGDSDGNTLYSIDVYAANSIINDCTFIMANAGSSGSLSVYYEGYANQTLTNNTLSNGVALTGGVELAVAKDNTFAATKGFGLGVSTIGEFAYTTADSLKLSLILAYLLSKGNVTTGFATGLNVESYL